MCGWVCVCEREREREGGVVAAGFFNKEKRKSQINLK